MRVSVFVLLAAMMVLVAPPATAAAVLTNGNFELPAQSVSGQFAVLATGWTKYEQSAGVAIPQIYCNLPGNPTPPSGGVPEGLQYGQVQILAAGGVASPIWGGIYQTVTGVTIGARYTIKGMFRTNSVSATASVRVDEAGGISRPATIGASTTIGAPTWTPFSFAVYPTASSMTIFLDTESRGLNKAAAFDAVSIPEPGSLLALLSGLIGLVGIRRRK